MKSAPSHAPSPWTTLRRTLSARNSLINRGKLFKQTEPLLGQLLAIIIFMVDSLFSELLEIKLQIHISRIDRDGKWKLHYEI